MRKGFGVKLVSLCAKADWEYETRAKAMREVGWEGRCLSGRQPPHMARRNARLCICARNNWEGPCPQGPAAA